MVPLFPEEREDKLYGFAWALDPEVMSITEDDGAYLDPWALARQVP